MDSKNTYLKHIIREELRLVKEQPMSPEEYEKYKATQTTPKAGGTATTPTPPKPATTTPTATKNPFKSKQSADHFREWVFQHHKEKAIQLGISRTGPLNDPKLISVFDKWKKDYWADIKTQKQTQKDIKNNTDTSGDIVGSLGLTLADFLRYGVYAAIGFGLISAGVFSWKGARWLFKKVKGTKLTPDQAMNIASNPKAFKQTIDKIAKANPKQLKKELQDLNPDEIISDDDVKAMQAALSKDSAALTVSVLIQSRRTILQSFKTAIKAGQLPKSATGKIITADQVINTLTPAERAKYANTIRELYDKIKNKQKFKRKVKKTWNNFREKLPYGD
jgi:hypothetical protein